jgi:hypothetical protein
MALLAELGRPPVLEDPFKVQSKLHALQTFRPASHWKTS